MCVQVGGYTIPGELTELYSKYCSLLILWLDVVTKLKFMDIVTLVIVCIH